MLRFLRLLVLTLCLVGGAAHGQILRWPSTTTVANLPGAPADQRMYFVSDGATTVDCAVGGGAISVLCWYDGSAWVAVAALPVLADHNWSTPTFDLQLGDADEGQIKFGGAYVGVADETISTTVFDDIFVISNTADSIEDISFVFMGALGVPRFVIAEEGADRATYNPRSMVIGPAATMANMDENILCSTNFSSIDCDTAGTGADLGVQDDVEVGGDIFAGGNVTLSLPTAQLLVPLQNDAVTPTLAFGDGDTGFYETADDALVLSIGTVFNAFFDGSWVVRGNGPGRPGMLTEDSSATNPNLIPDTGDADTGIGSPTPNQLSLIAGGVEGVRINTIASGVNYVDVTPATTTNGPIIAAAGSDTDIDLVLSPKGTGAVGIGISAPIEKLHVLGSVMMGDATTSLGATTQLQFSRDGNPTMAFRHIAAGSSANFPLIIDAYTKDDGGTERRVVQIFADVTTQHATQPGAALGFSTTPAGGSLTERLSIADTGNLVLGADALIQRDTNAALTASTTQTQGQAPLTAEVNEVATVANDNDTVTMPAAIAGLKIVVVNNGTMTLQIFPASGDDLGAGVNAAVTLEANEVITFVAYTATTWVSESSTEIAHAEIHDEDNTDAYVVNDAGADFHSYHTNGLTGGDLAGWTFDAGGGGTSFPIASVADSGGSPGTQILVTTTGSHLLSVGDIISQTNLADAAYVGVFAVLATASATTYEVAAVFTATGTGTLDQAATLICGVGRAGSYQVQWWSSATTATNNETFDFVLYKEAATITGTKMRRKFGTATDFGALSGGGLVTVADGEHISLALSNEDSAGNITLRNLTIVMIRL